MSDVVERLAKIMCDILANEDPDGDLAPWHNLNQNGRDAWCDDARKILTALRDPTPEMVAAGQRETDTRDSGEDDFKRGWHAAIDVALGE